MKTSKILVTILFKVDILKIDFLQFIVAVSHISFNFPLSLNYCAFMRNG